VIIYQTSGKFHLDATKYFPDKELELQVTKINGEIYKFFKCLQQKASLMDQNDRYFSNF